MNNVRRLVIRCTLALAFAGLIAGHARAASLMVANDGTDSSSCGSSSEPCRSISQAIMNAPANATIWVGAGRYGDVSRTGTFTVPGDEQATLLPYNDFGFRGCIVCINKPVRVYSTSGAAMTTIDSGPSRAFDMTVDVTADGAVFGAVGHGFTVIGGNAIGVAVDLEHWRYTSRFGVTVTGNVDVGDGRGFVVNGPDGCNPGLVGCVCPPPGFGACGWHGAITLWGNEAINNGTGFSVEPKLVIFQPGLPLPYLVQENVARGAGVGFFVQPGYVECDDCFDNGTASEVLTVHNVATNGVVGFSLTRAGSIRDNMASNNSQYGFFLEETGAFVRNSAISNAGPGVVILDEAVECCNQQPVAYPALSANNFIGNDRNRPALSFGGYGGAPYDFSAGPSANCGVLNMGAIGQSLNLAGLHGPPAPPVPSVTLHATQNFWGSAAGPEPNGPGDAAGGACDQYSAITLSKPFAATIQPITPTSLP